MTSYPPDRYRKLFDLAPIARLSTDLDGAIQDANQEATRLFDRPHDQLVGTPVGRLVVEHDRPVVQRAIEEACALHPTEAVVTLARDTTPATRVALLGVYLDEPPTVQWSARDVTTEEEARASLRRALENERATAEGLRALAELRDIFLTAIAHDLRSPLAALLNLVEVLRHRPDLDARRQEELLERIDRTAREMSALVIDLLDLTRSEHGVMPLDRSEADLAATVRRAVAQATALDGEGVDVELDVESVVAAVDHRLVGRIVSNLVTNALQHIPAGGRVWVRLRRAAEGALLTVEDDGPGIPDDAKPRVFELFGRGERSASLGIGLQLVRRFAELHDGWAAVGDRPGGGASFRVLIPTPLADDALDVATPQVGVPAEDGPS